MGGKTSTSTQGVSIPPSVLAQYQSVNNAATQTAQTPFQSYSGQFVAPVNSEQTAGINATNTAANEAQPYFGAATSTLGSAQAGVNPVNQAATGLAAASGEQVNAAPITGSDINQYLSPYLGDVLGTTNALANQNNNIAQSGELGNAISSGAFGGDRTGIAAANLNQQNSLAEQSTDAGILNTGFNTALSTAQQQQGVNLSAGQANRAALGSAGSELASIGSTAYGEGANTASELGSLGSGAQAAGLAGAQAQIGAGTVQQQTQQAQDTAEYNQFLQQQSYPFQVDQFLAGIAEGTGALSGSTTTTTQPGGFFSDKRLKHDIKKIGETFDGQTIYSYKMHGDNRTHIGLIAQSVEKKHPDAVGLAAGFKTVDYGKATDAAAHKGKFASGGVAGRAHYDGGGYAGPYGDMSSILATQENMYQPNQARNRNIPMQQGQSHQLAVASGSPTPGPSGSSKVQQSIGLGKDGYQAYNHFATPNSPNLAPTNAQISSDPSMTALQSPQMAAAPSSPVAAPSSGLGASGAADAGATSAPSAGLAGGAATDAAASAAPAAASIAAPAAADAAAGAAGGAAVDAGATEAAALAAEYAAADVGVAALAAKRGGRIRRAGGGLAGRRGYDDGGTPYEGGVAGAPYSDPSGQMDIPDDPNTAKLQTAGPLVKRPTGLQTAMTLGSEQGASSALGSMFSNQGLGSKRGGRIGYDSGGGIDPSADPDLSPVVIDPSDVKMPEPKPGLAAADMKAPAANDDSAPDAQPQKKSALGAIGDWWDRNKTNAIPALEGLAAMGTAPTKHFGVALAAGLGAGAQAYMPTQQAAANLQATQIQNQMSGTQLGMLQGALKQPQGGSGRPAAPPAPAPTDTNVLQAYYANKYNPNMTPSELSQYNQAQIASGYTKNPGIAQRVMTDYQQRVKSQQTAAQLEHDQANTIATADGGNYQILRQVNPNQAQAIAKTLGFDPSAGTAPPAADAAAIKYATDVVDFTHPWTGDTYTDQEGQKANSRTSAPPPPQSRAAQQLTPEQKQQAYEKYLTLGQTPTVVGGGLPQMPWERANAASPEAYAAAHVPGGYAPQSAPGAAPASVAPRPPVRTLPNQPPPQTKTPTQPQTQMLPGVDISQMPKLPTAPPVTDQVSLDQAKKIQDNNREVQNAALGPLTQQVAAAARNSALYNQLQQKLSTADPREFGPSSSAYKSIQNLRTYLSGIPPDGLVNQTEVDKYLSQLGVGGSKQLLGSDQQLRQQELLMLMSHANPHIDQPLQVIKNLAAFGKAGNDYDMKAANTGIAAIRGGADPFSVPGSIENQVRRASYVNGALNTPQGALDHLKAHPELAPQFKAKYGYLP